MQKTINSKIRFFVGFVANALCVVFAGTLSAQQVGEYSANSNGSEVSVVSEFPAVVGGSIGDYPPVAGQNLQASEVAQPCADCANEKKAADAAVDLKKKVATAHKLTFFDNDFSYLCDPNYCGSALGDRLKQLTLPHGSCLSVGGQYRARAHVEQNIRGLGLTGVDDQFLLNRLRIYGDLQLNQNFRIYAEMIDADSNYENFPPRPIDENHTDLLNMFVDARLLAGPRGELSTRIGRQELVFGAQRLISNLDWANTRRTFEGARVTMKNENATIDGFWANPMRKNTNSFDSPDRDQEFMGLYSSFKRGKNRTIDAYYLRYLNGRGTNNFKIDTAGMRLQGNNGQWLYDMEGAYQYGDNTDGSNHEAGMVTLGVGRKNECHSWKPTLWLYYDWASGDDLLGAGNGFHHLFPLAHKYNGFMDLFGRRNLEDVNIQFSTTPTDKLKLLVWYHYLFLENKNDSPYSVVMTPFNGGNVPGSADLGHEIDMIADMKLGPRQSLLLGYSHFFSGEYYSTTAGVPFSGDADFFYSQWTINF